MLSRYEKALIAQYLVLDLLSSHESTTVRDLRQRLTARQRTFDDARIDFDFAEWSQGDLEDVLTKFFCCRFVEGIGFEPDMSRRDWRQVAVLLTPAGRLHAETMRNQLDAALDDFLSCLGKESGEFASV